MLSRDQMVAIIQRGESVMIGSEVIDSVDALPSEAQLALGDPQREQAALAALDSQLGALQAQRELLLRQQLARQPRRDEGEGMRDEGRTATPPAPPAAIPAPPPDEPEGQVTRREALRRGK